MTASLIDHDSPLPRWAQIADDLFKRLSGHEFLDRFPTEAQLAAQYEVSRSTVRQALAKLSVDGVLERRQGLGTFLAQPKKEGQTWGVSSLALSLKAIGVKESSKVLVLDRRETSRRNELLSLPKTAKLIYVERLRLGDGKPLALDRSWLPFRLAQGLLKADLSQGSLYGALAESCGIQVTGGREQVRPLNPSVKDRKALEVPKQDAVFYFHRLTFAGEIRVEYRETQLRGDRYELLSNWGRVTPTGPGVATPSI